MWVYKLILLAEPTLSVWGGGWKACLSVCVSQSICLSVWVDGWLCSYKEQSDDATDTDDLIEVEVNEADHERETAETVEKVLRHRIGRKGGKFLISWPLYVVTTLCSDHCTQLTTVWI